MISSRHITGCALLVLAASNAFAQAQTSRGAQVLLEGVGPATRAAIAATSKDLAHRMKGGAIKTDTPLARSCNFILGDAARIYDEHRLIDSAFHALRFREWMCQSEFSTRDELSEAASALDMVNPGFGSMLGYMLKDDRAAFTRQMGQFCTTGYEFQVDPTVRENFERQARASMTDAYKTCVASSIDTAVGKSGAFAYATPLDRTLQHYTVSVRWGQDSNDRRIDAIRTEGAQCKVASAKGDAILRLACARTTEGTGVVTLTTARGTETILLPGQADVARVTLEERLLILHDRIRLLEQGLEKVAPQMLADLRDAARE